MRSRTLLSQVLAINTVLVAVTAVLVGLLAQDDRYHPGSPEGIAPFAIAVLAVILLNSILLRRRLEPLDRILRTMDVVDLSSPGLRAETPQHSSAEIKQLSRVLNRMLDRLEEERRASGRAVVRAQEQERQQIAQDLHDEVNQALTAIKLRLSAVLHIAPESLRRELRDTKYLVDQAMDELLHIARELRPTALDDHGLVPALRSQVEGFGERTGIRARFSKHGAMPDLSDEEQMVIYRVTQESLSNVAQHSGAQEVEVHLSFTGRTVLKVTDDGSGFPARFDRSGAVRGRPGGLGLSGMRERALLVGGNLEIYTRNGDGTTVELTMGVR